MPAELSVRGDGRVEMAYALEGGVPWHGAGSVLDADAQRDTRRALETAGLDWGTATGPVYGPDRQELDAYRAVYRMDSRAVLGVTGDGYRPIANADAAGILDPLILDGVLRWETLGALQGGRVCWGLGKILTDLTIAGEAYREYVLVSWSHDGTGALRGAPTGVRVVCANTLALAERDLRRGPLSVRHTGDVAGKVKAAREFLRQSTESFARFKEFAERAALAKVTAAAYAPFESALFGADAVKRGEESSSVRKFRVVLGQERARGGATWYSVINGVTGYADHALSTRGGAEGRFASTQLGAAAQFKARALSLVREIVKEVTPA